MITSINEYKHHLNESNYPTVYYHGSTDRNMEGKKGIHVGTYLAAKQALEARIGVPAEGEWDGTREYGKTLLAGKNSLETNPEHKWKCTGFNCGSDVPKEDYYPTQRKERATYSDGTPIPFDSKPIIFPVQIVGQMSNWPGKPHSDVTANALIMRGIRKGNAKSGFYYINDGEDAGSISAVVPDKSFLKIVENNMVNEAKVTENIIYHFTSVYGVVSILNDKIIRHDLNRDYLDADNVSFTTDFDFYKRAISKFTPKKKTVALVFDAAKMRTDGYKMYYHTYKGTKDYDYSKEAEVRVKGSVPAKYIKEIIFIDKFGQKDPVFYKQAIDRVKQSKIPYRII